MSAHLRTSVAAGPVRRNRIAPVGKSSAGAVPAALNLAGMRRPPQARLTTPAHLYLHSARIRESHQYDPATGPQLHKPRRGQVQPNRRPPGRDWLHFMSIAG
jgi:hypothetical protein